MNNSNFDDIDEVVKNSDFTIFCDIKDWGSESEFSDFLLYEARHLVDSLNNKDWLMYIMNYYRKIKQKYYLVVKNNFCNIYFNYLFDDNDINHSFLHTDEENCIKDNNKDNGFYERLQEYYNTHRRDLLRFKYRLADYGNGDFYIIVYIKKSMCKLNICYKDYFDVDIAEYENEKDHRTYSLYICNNKVYPMPTYILSKVSAEEIFNFIKETNFTDEEKEKYYLDLICIMAVWDKFI